MNKEILFDNKQETTDHKQYLLCFMMENMQATLLQL